MSATTQQRRRRNRRQKQVKSKVGKKEPQVLFDNGCTTCGEYESMVRDTCGTMTPQAYRELMATCPGIEADQLDELVQDFELQSAMLSADCRATFASITDSPRSVLKLFGGSEDEDEESSQDEEEDEDEDEDDEESSQEEKEDESQEEESSQEESQEEDEEDEVAKQFRAARATYVKRKPKLDAKKKAPQAPAPDWKQECPNNYSKKRKCVVDPVTDKCIPEREIAGDSKTGSRFSDGQCYGTFQLQAHARSQHASGKKTLHLPSGKEYSRSDLDKIDKTRLASYCHQTLLSSISSAVETRVNSSNDQQRETFEVFLKKLRTDKVKTSRKSNKLWSVFRSGMQHIARASTKIFKMVYKVGSWLASKAISLGRFIASNPRMARFFLLMVKEMVNIFCQKMAIAIGKATYKYKGVGERVYDAATGEVAQMAAEGMVKEVLTGDGMGKLASGLFSFVKESVKGIPVVGAIANGAEAFVDVVGGPAKEAMKFAAELAIYKQDVNKSFASVLDILTMVVNPVKCMNANQHVDTFDASLEGKQVLKAGGGNGRSQGRTRRKTSGRSRGRSRNRLRTRGRTRSHTSKRTRRKTDKKKKKEKLAR